MVGRGQFAWVTFIRVPSLITPTLKWIKTRFYSLGLHGGATGGKRVESYEVTPHERSLSHWGSTLEGNYEMPVSSCLLLFAFWLTVQEVLVCPILPSSHAVLVKCQSHGHLVLDRSLNEPVFYVRSLSWVFCCIS